MEKYVKPDIISDFAVNSSDVQACHHSPTVGPVRVLIGQSYISHPLTVQLESIQDIGIIDGPVGVHRTMVHDNF